MCLFLGQCHGMIHAFLSECSARKWHLQNNVSSHPLDVNSVGVIGMGTMGRGIAISLLRAG